MERVMGIEPTSKAWEALVLPLNYTRMMVERKHHTNSPGVGDIACIKNG